MHGSLSLFGLGFTYAWIIKFVWFGFYLLTTFVQDINTQRLQSTNSDHWSL